MLILFDIDDTLLDHTAAAHAGARALHASVGSSLAVDVFRAHLVDGLVAGRNTR